MAVVISKECAKQAKEEQETLPCDLDNYLGMRIKQSACNPW